MSAGGMGWRRFPQIGVAKLSVYANRPKSLVVANLVGAEVYRAEVVGLIWVR